MRVLRRAASNEFAPALIGRLCLIVRRALAPSSAEQKPK
jgi:hypothetical protein